MSANEKPGRLRVRMGDRESLQEARMILAYEATMRGLTLGQACSELLSEAADVGSYPPEVRARLAEIAEGAGRRGVERSLSMGAAAEDE